MTEQKQKRSYSSRAKLAMVTVMVLLLVAGIVGYRVYQMNHLYVDGSIRREPKSAVNAMDVDDFKGWIKSFTFKEDLAKNEIRVLMPSYPQMVTLTDPPLVEELSFSDGEQLDIPQGGKLRITKYGFTGEKNEKDQYSIVWKQTVAEDDMESKVKNSRSGDILTQRSVVCLLESEDPSSMWVKSIRLRDKQTGFYFSSGWGHQPLERDESLALEKWSLTTILIHQRPVEVIFDVYCGEKIIRKFPMVDQHVETMGDCQIALVKAYPKKKNSGLGGGDTLYGFSPAEKNTGVSIKTSQCVDFQIRAITLNGEEKKSWSSTSSSCNYSFLFDVPYNEVESFEVTTWTEHYLAVYSIEEVLTLPDQANLRGNLLKTQISSIEFQREWEFRNFWPTAMLLQYSGGPSPTFPKGYFPKKFENVTVEELFLEYLEYLPNHGTPEINEEEGTLKIPVEDKKGWLEPVLDDALK